MKGKIMLKAKAIIPNLMELIEGSSNKPVTSKLVYKDDALNVILFRFAASEGLSEHTSDKPVVLHILQGEAQVTLGDEPIVACAGTWMYMPAKLPHSIIAQTPVYMLLQIFKGQGG